MPEVKVEDDGAVRIVTINRPETRNAIDKTTASALSMIFEDYDSDRTVDVAVLTGADGTFCSGADLKAIGSQGVNEITRSGRGPLGPTRMRLAKPVIAAIEGHAVAGGLELALWCDLRVAAENAVLGVFNRRFGVPLVDMGTIRLPRLIGQSHAMDLILTGRPVTAGEAFGMGLVNRLASPGRALEHALGLARELAKHPQTCLRGDRLSVLEQWSLNEREAIQNEVRHGLATVTSGETAAGAASFVEGAGRHGEDVSH